MSVAQARLMTFFLSIPAGILSLVLLRRGIRALNGWSAQLKHTLRVLALLYVGMCVSQAWWLGVYAALVLGKEARGGPYGAIIVQLVNIAVLFRFLGLQK